MPRTVDPSTIAVGGGRAPDLSVGDSSLRNPDRDTLPLQAHVEDPSRVHEAAAIHIVDAGSLYASDEVEGALQEVGGGSSAGFLNGLVAGGTWSSLNFDVTLGATQVLVNGALYNATGLTFTLLPNQTVYLYIDQSTGLLASNAAAPAPNLEHILIAEITTDGFAVTGWRDARFFVPNVQRKPSFTLRSGGADPETEGCFITLEAALLWLEIYTPTGAVGPKKIVIRGQYPIATTVALPVNDIIFEGEGGSGFITSGAFPIMFDLNGKNGITFRNLKFTADHANCTAISDGGVAHSFDLTVESCQFLQGAQAWFSAIVLTDNASPNAGHIVRDCQIFSTDRGIFIERPETCLVSHCLVNEVGVVGTYGIEISNTAYAGEGHSVVESCNVQGYEVGVQLTGESHVLRDSFLAGSILGVVLNDGGLHVVSGTTIELSNTDSARGGFIGIWVEAKGSTIDNCLISNPRVAWTVPPAGPPQGVAVADGISDVTVNNCQIDGFFDDTAVGGDGIALGTTCPGAILTDNRISTADVGINITAATQVKIQGCTISKVRAGILHNGEDSTILENIINLDGTRAELGIILTGSPQTKVAYNTLTNTRAAWGVEVTIGIQTDDEICEVSHNTLSGFFNPTAVDGVGIEAGGDSVLVLGNHISGSFFGVNIPQGSYKTKVLSNYIDGDAKGFFGVVANGVDGVGTRIGGLQISDNTIRGLVGDPAVTGPGAGIQLGGHIRGAVIEGNDIDLVRKGSPAYRNPLAYGIFGKSNVANYLDGVQVSDNRISRCYEGVCFQGTVDVPNTSIIISNNQIGYCGYAQDLAGSPPPDTYVGRGSKGIGIEYALDVVVNDNLIRKIGVLIDEGGSEAPPLDGAAADVQAKGVYLRNCFNPVVRGNVIRNLMVVSTTIIVTTEGIYFEIQSSGAVAPYITDTLDISGNEVMWDSSAGDEFGIYIQAQDGTTAQPHTIASAKIEGNTVFEAGQAGVALIVLNRGNIFNPNISDNIIKNCCGGAPILLQQASILVQAVNTVATNTGNLAGFKISGNRIQNSSQSGVLVYVDRECETNNLLVSDNHISESANAGLEFAATINCLLGGLSRVEVRGNTVQDSTGANIVFGVSGAAGTPAADLHSITVSGNTINSTGAGTGVTLNATTGTLKDIHVEGNSFRGDGTMVSGVTMTQTPAGLGSENIQISNNLVNATAAQAIFLDFTSKVSGLTINGNSLLSSATGAIHVVCGHDMESLGISSNVIHKVTSGRAISVDITGVGTNLVVSGNAVLATVSGIYIATGSHLNLLSMTGNNISVSSAAGDGLNLQITGTPSYSSFVSNNVTQAGAGRTLTWAWGGAPATCGCTGNTSDGVVGTDGWGAALGAGDFCQLFGVGVNNFN
jgi:hypothetical protein